MFIIIAFSASRSNKKLHTDQMNISSFESTSFYYDGKGGEDISFIDINKNN